MGRPEPRNPAAFLIDQDKSRFPAHRIPQIGHKSANLFGCFNIAGEQNKAQRIGIAEERALIGGQFQAGTTEYHGVCRTVRHHPPCHRLTTKQPIFFFFNASQTFCADALSANGPPWAW